MPVIGGNSEVSALRELGESRSREDCSTRRRVPRTSLNEFIGCASADQGGGVEFGAGRSSYYWKGPRSKKPRSCNAIRAAHLRNIRRFCAPRTSRRRCYAFRRLARLLQGRR